MQSRCLTEMAYQTSELILDPYKNCCHPARHSCLKNCVSYFLFYLLLFDFANVHSIFAKKMFFKKGNIRPRIYLESFKWVKMTVITIIANVY